MSTDALIFMMLLTLTPQHDTPSNFHRRDIVAAGVIEEVSGAPVAAPPTPTNLRQVIIRSSNEKNGSNLNAAVGQ